MQKERTATIFRKNILKAEYGARVTWCVILSLAPRQTSALLKPSANDHQPLWVLALGKTWNFQDLEIKVNEFPTPEDLFGNMWPIIFNFLRIYAPYVVWPAAAVVGVIGYNAEKLLRGDAETPWAESTKDKRGDRQLVEAQVTDTGQVDKLKDRTFVPKTIFGKNDFSGKVES